MNKIFFFDYDGTLVENHTKSIPNSAKKALQKLKQQGHTLILNTGRTKGILDPETYEWPFDGMILGCGTYISYQNEVLFEKELSQDLCEEIKHLMQYYHGEVFYEGSDALYVAQDITHPDLRRMIKRYQENHLTIYSDTEKEKHVNKLFICFHEESMKLQFMKEGPRQFQYIDRGMGRLEMVPIGFSKATGITYILNHLHRDVKDCYVFGDSNNDLPMFDMVKQSILIGGENPELKHHVMYVSEDVMQDGVWKACHHLGLFNEF